MIVDFARHHRVEKRLEFEPSTLCAGIIERSYAMNDLRNVTVVTKAVGEQVGCGTMPRDARTQFSTSVRMEEQHSAADGKLFESVEVTTLDVEIPNPSGLWVTVIDVEDGELAVLRGGQAFLRTVHPLIIFEYHEVTRTHFSLDDVRAELGNDYELFRLRLDGFLDRDLRQTWNCVTVPTTSPFHVLISTLITDDRPKLSTHRSVSDALVGGNR